jgi:phosphoribosylformylglycinamidine synthase
VVDGRSRCLDIRGQFTVTLDELRSASGRTLPALFGVEEATPPVLEFFVAPQVEQPGPVAVEPEAAAEEPEPAESEEPTAAEEPAEPASEEQ